jgi:hypothetical protein
MLFNLMSATMHIHQKVALDSFVEMIVNRISGGVLGVSIPERSSHKGIVLQGSGASSPGMHREVSAPHLNRFSLPPFYLSRAIFVGKSDLTCQN